MPAHRVVKAIRIESNMLYTVAAGVGYNPSLTAPIALAMRNSTGIQAW